MGTRDLIVELVWQFRDLEELSHELGSQAPRTKTHASSREAPKLSNKRTAFWYGNKLTEATVIGRDDLILRLDHLSVDETLNAILEEVGMVHRLH